MPAWWDRDGGGIPLSVRLVELAVGVCWITEAGFQLWRMHWGSLQGCADLSALLGFEHLQGMVWADLEADRWKAVERWQWMLGLFTANSLGRSGQRMSSFSASRFGVGDSWGSNGILRRIDALERVDVLQTSPGRRKCVYYHLNVCILYMNRLNTKNWIVCMLCWCVNCDLDYVSVRCYIILAKLTIHNHYEPL